MNAETKDGSLLHSADKISTAIFPDPEQCRSNSGKMLGIDRELRFPDKAVLCDIKANIGKFEKLH